MSKKIIPSHVPDGPWDLKDRYDPPLSYQLRQLELEDIHAKLQASRDRPIEDFHERQKTHPVGKFEIDAKAASVSLKKIADKFRSGLPGSGRNHVFLPPIPSSIQRISDETSVHIYNVGPWEHKAMLGSWGDVLVPPCAGPSYCRANPIPGVFIEPIPAWGNQMIENRYIDGMDVAREAVGLSRQMPAGASMLPYGMFIGFRRGPKAIPLKKELAAARQLLREKCRSLVKDGNSIHAKSKRRDGVQPETIGWEHQLAAKYLKRKVKWMQ